MTYHDFILFHHDLPVKFHGFYMVFIGFRSINSTKNPRFSRTFAGQIWAAETARVLISNWLQLRRLPNLAVWGGNLWENLWEIHGKSGHTMVCLFFGVQGHVRSRNCYGIEWENHGGTMGIWDVASNSGLGSNSEAQNQAMRRTSIWHPDGMDWNGKWWAMKKLQLSILQLGNDDPMISQVFICLHQFFCKDNELLENSDEVAIDQLLKRKNKHRIF